MSTLEIAGIPATKLAQAVGTPVIVYDEGEIEDKLREYTENFVSGKFATEIVYASKAFTCSAMIEKVNQAGACLDVVSGGEMMIAKEGGMDMSRVYFHGNNKTAEELKTCMESGCGNIVLDNKDEVRELIKAAEASGRSINAMLRVNPLVEAHTHEFIVTAASDSKFGISIEEKESIAELIKLAQSSRYINFVGFHSHIGSQIFGSSAFEKAADKMVTFMKDMKDYCGYEGKWLSLGGGFGIHYTDDDQPIPVSEMCRKLITKCETTGYPLEKVMIEPGRSIVGEAGTALYTAGYQKMAGGKRYLFVDGGMGDNIRPALYDALYDADIANRIGEPKDTEYCVAGKYCESGDVLIKKIKLQQAQEGDILAMYSCGAYGYSMASCYNGIGKPAVIFAKDGKARLVIRRETYKDLLNLETDEEVI
ncbi:MAG: diaminopimelate decarboxylase [Anaerovoracaceae bacterium]